MVEGANRQKKSRPLCAWIFFREACRMPGSAVQAGKAQQHDLTLCLSVRFREACAICPEAQSAEEMRTSKSERPARQSHFGDRAQHAGWRQLTSAGHKGKRGPPANPSFSGAVRKVGELQPKRGGAGARETPLSIGSALPACTTRWCGQPTRQDTRSKAKPLPIDLFGSQLQQARSRDPSKQGERERASLLSNGLFSGIVCNSREACAICWRAYSTAARCKC
jgi:hypothetical protein